MVNIKSTPGMFFGGAVFVASATTHYLHVYNDTDGNGSIIYTQPLDGNAHSLFEISGGIKCSTAISVKATTGFDGTGNPGSNIVDACLFYV